MSAVVAPLVSANMQVASDQPWYEWIRLVTLRKCLWLQSLWSQTDPTGPDPNTQASLALRSPQDATFEEAMFLDSSQEAIQLSASIEAAESALREHQAWKTLVQTFRLDRHSQELLAVCVAAEVNPEVKKAFAYVLDQAEAVEPSQWLVSVLFGWGHAISVSPSSSLYAWRIAYPTAMGPQAWTSPAPWIVDPCVMAFLRGTVQPDPTVAGAVQFRKRELSAELPCLHEPIRKSAKEFLCGARDRPLSRCEIEIVGPAGSGRTTLCSQIACDLECDVIAIACASLLPPGADHDIKKENVARAARTAALFGALPIWQCETEAISPYLRDLGGVHFITTARREPATPPSDVGRKSYVQPELTRSQRVRLWESLTGLPVPDPVREWAMTPAEIVDAAKIAAISPDKVHEACLEIARLDPGDLFSLVPCPFTWDDLVVPPQLEAHLKEFEDQARMRGALYEEWGYSKHRPLGRGVAALFAGPSGTGKTMAAQILARSLDLQLYRVDMAGVLNKYVGETEKHIRKVFEKCRRTNALLFFDEADAFFSNRVQTRDAHDRFANMEINYLLQQMEQYDGVAILATNRKGELDSSFLRRLQFVVDFRPPQPAERLRLWKLALIERAPNGEPLIEEIDWSLLASKLNLTGSEIKNCAIAAAFRARTEGAKVGMRHVMAAVRRELTKKSVILRPGDTEF